MTPKFHFGQVFFPFAAAYFLSYLLRTANAVLSAPLTEEFSLSAAELGLLSSAYFLTFAVMQIPLGAMLDRRGPRNVEAGLLIFAVIGCLVSAFASGFVSLWVGRALIGLGVSACLMGAYKGFRQCFSEDKQASLASLMLVVGSFGALAATLPIELMLPSLGWRGVFLLTAFLLALTAAGIFWLLPDMPVPPVSENKFWGDTLTGFKQVFSNYEFGRYIPYAIFVHGGFLAVHSLWVGPWLRTVDGLRTDQAAAALLLFGAMQMVGHLSMSGLATQFSKWRWNLDSVIFYGIAIMLVAGVIAVFNLLQDTMLSWSIMFLSTACLGLIYAKIGLVFPKNMAGRANTAVNLIVFVGAFGLQWGLGIVIDAFRQTGLDEAASYQAAFICWLLTILFTLVWMWLRPPPRGPKPA